MACCNFALAGMAKDCEGSLGGIRRVWLASWCDVSATVEDGVIASITPSDAWHEYEFKKNTGSLTSTLNKDDTSGATYWHSDIVLQFNRLETSKRLEIVGLSNSDAAAIVEDRNGRYWYLGYEEPVEMSDGGTAETGTAQADFNGYNVTLGEDSKEPPYEVPASVMEPILSGPTLFMRPTGETQVDPGIDSTSIITIESNDDVALTTKRG